MRRWYMRHSRCFFQYRHERGRENGATWEVIVNHGKDYAPNIHTARDILEGNSGPLCRPKEVSLWMPYIGISVL